MHISTIFFFHWCYVINWSTGIEESLSNNTKINYKAYTEKPVIIKILKSSLLLEHKKKKLFILKTVTVNFTTYIKKKKRNF